MGITNQEIDELLAKKIAIFMHIFIEYADGFADTPIRRTAMCYEVSLDRDPRIERPDEAFKVKGGPPEHNTAS